MSDRAPTRASSIACVVLAVVVALALVAAPARAEQRQEFAQGYELYKSELYRGAVALFERGLAIEPDNGLAHFYAAESYYKLGELQPALDHYRAAASFLPPGTEATKTSNMIVAIEAEFGAAGTAGELPEPSATATTEEPAATTTSGPADWSALTADTGALSQAISDYYEVNQPAPEAKDSSIINVFSIALDSTSRDQAVVKFRCEVKASHGKTGIFRARVTLLAEGDSYRVIEFNKDEQFDIVKGFAY